MYFVRSVDMIERQRKIETPRDVVEYRSRVIFRVHALPQSKRRFKLVQKEVSPLTERKIVQVLAWYQRLPSWNGVRHPVAQIAETNKENSGWKMEATR